MADIVANALDWLASRRRATRTVTVTYRRGQDEIEIPATRGQTTGEAVGADNVSYRTFIQDYILTAADLEIDDEAFKPGRGDRIVDTVNGEVRVYQILPMESGLHYRECDPNGTDLRVHTKLIDAGEEGQV